MQNGRIQVRMGHQVCVRELCSLAVVQCLHSACLDPELRRRHAQHETASDIEDGGRVFRQQLRELSWPGWQRDRRASISGAAQFKRAKTDEDLVRIIRNGIPGTPMPAEQHVRRAGEARRRLSPFASRRRRRSASAAGDAARGKTLFEGKGAARAAIASTASARGSVPT